VTAPNPGRIIARRLLSSSVVIGLLLLPVCQPVFQGGLEPAGHAPLSYARLDFAHLGIAATQDRPAPLLQLLPFFLSGQVPEPETRSSTDHNDVRPQPQTIRAAFSGTSPRPPPSGTQSFSDLA
jgi:hypothetical protein